jgi:hypothetical protein
MVGVEEDGFNALSRKLMDEAIQDGKAPYGKEGFGQNFRMGF